MTLIQEAMLDDQFRVQIGKIQDALQKLNELARTFEKEQHRPVKTQILQLEVAAKDLDSLTIRYQGLR